MSKADDAVQLMAEAYEKHQLWTLHVMGLAHLYRSLARALEDEGKNKEAEKFKIIGDTANALYRVLEGSRSMVTEQMEARRSAYFGKRN